MAEQEYTVSSGFYDAVNNDRTYSADDMNNIFYNVFGDGVIAKSTADNALKVISGGGSVIQIYSGNAIFGRRWFISDTFHGFTIPVNSAAYARMDSVIARVDTRVAERVAKLVYITGTPDSAVEPPEINQTGGVIEYRIANIKVPIGAAIPEEIYDLRGTDECPFIITMDTFFDTWRVISLQNSVTAANLTPSSCMLGKNVFIRGNVTNIPAAGTTIGTLPENKRPARYHNFTAVTSDGSGITSTVLMQVDHYGVIKILIGSGYSSSDTLYIDTSFTTL